MHIEQLTSTPDDWDDFAESRSGVRLGHASAWATVLSDAYGLEPLYLSARDEQGSLCGILPLIAFKSRPAGSKRLISLPYLDAAGLLAADGESEKKLLDHALGLMASRGFDGLELRSSSEMQNTPKNNVGSAAIDRVNLVLPLEADPELQWKALRAKVRNQSRKAEREGLTLAEGSSADLIDAFYEPFCANMRDLGSPVHAKAFFEAAARHFGERFRFIVTRDGDRPVGGLVAIRFGHRVSVPWASTLRSERKRCPNNQIYWEAIKWAIESGATEFDFGRSPIEGGTYRFKKGWGAVEEPLSWRRFDAGGLVQPALTGPPSPILEQLSRVWTRLPVPLASFLGARIRRYFSN